MATQEESVPTLNQKKLYLVLLPLGIAFYLVALKLCGVSLQTTWFDIFPGVESVDLGKGYNRLHDLWLGPLLVFMMMKLLTLLSSSHASAMLDKLLSLLFIGVFIGAIAMVITFPLAGAVAATIVGIAWFGATVLLVAFVYTFFTLTSKTVSSLRDWLHR